MRKILLPALLFLVACDATTTVGDSSSPQQTELSSTTGSGAEAGEITQKDLAESYLDLLYCVDLNFWELPEDDIPSNVDKALLICDVKLEDYANLLSDKALQDNGWSRYTQPIPQKTKRKIRQDTAKIMRDNYARIVQ